MQLDETEFPRLIIAALRGGSGKTILSIGTGNGWKEKEMLSYPEDGKLEKLLEELFSDDSDLASDDVTVLSLSIGPIMLPSIDCCSYSFAGYNPP